MRFDGNRSKYYFVRKEAISHIGRSLSSHLELTICFMNLVLQDIMPQISSFILSSCFCFSSIFGFRITL